MYKVAIIGCGGINRYAHTPFYLTDAAKKRVEVAALCDILPDRVKSFRDEFHPQADIYTDYKEVLKRDDIDYVDICTPNYLHSEIALAALRAGKNVFCEKPDAINPALAEEMKELSEKTGKTLMFMRNNRYADISKVAKKFIEDGRMGEIYAGRACWQRVRGIPGKGGWFTTKEQSGGGPLIDLGVHMIDLAIWLMGNPTPVAVSGNTFCKFANNDLSTSTESVYGDAKADGTFDVEDLAMGMIRFDNGAILQIEFSWASNVLKESRFVELRGTKAGMYWTDGGNLEIVSEEYGKMNVTKYEGNCNENIHGANLNHYLDVLDGKVAPDFVPQQGVNMIKILSAVYESARTGKEVQL